MIQKTNKKLCDSIVQYDLFWDTFWKSRKNLHWEDIDFLLDDLSQSEITNWKILDVGCGNGRLFDHLKSHKKYVFFQKILHSYLWIDMSQILLNQALKNHSQSHIFYEQKFMYWDMRWLESMISWEKYDAIFFIASYHHLFSYAERVNVLNQAVQSLSKNGKIYMTNWNLLHPLQEKYSRSRIVSYPDWSADFDIKIGAHSRMYHSFSEEEYNHLAKKSWLMVSANFGEKNSVVIFQKKSQ